jgi:hypothetical protein
MGNISITSVHRNAATDKVAVNYRNAEMVLGTKIFPTVPVKKEGDVYHLWTKADIFRDDAHPVMPGARASRGGFGLETPVAYQTECVKFAWAIPDRVKANMDSAVAADANATVKCMDKIALSKERVISDYLTGTSASWTSSETIAAGSEFDSAGGGDPIGVFKTAVSTIQGLLGVTPNKAAMSWKVWWTLRFHPAIRDYIKYSSDSKSPSVASTAIMAELFGLEEIVVCKAIYNSANPGATAVYADVMTDTVWVGYVTKAPSIMEPSAGYIFQAGPPTTKSWREEPEEQDVVEAKENYVAKATCADAGYRIINCLA